MIILYQKFFTLSKVSILDKNAFVGVEPTQEYSYLFLILEPRLKDTRRCLYATTGPATGSYVRAAALLFLHLL